MAVRGAPYAWLRRWMGSDMACTPPHGTPVGLVGGRKAPQAKALLCHPAALQVRVCSVGKGSVCVQHDAAVYAGVCEGLASTTSFGGPPSKCSGTARVPADGPTVCAAHICSAVGRLLLFGGEAEAVTQQHDRWVLCTRGSCWALKATGHSCAVRRWLRHAPRRGAQVGFTHG